MLKSIVRFLFASAIAVLVQPSFAQSPEQKGLVSEEKASSEKKPIEQGEQPRQTIKNPQPDEQVDVVLGDDDRAKREQAIKDAKAELRRAEQKFGKRHVRLVKLLTALAQAYEANRQDKEAGVAYQRALAILKREPRGHRREIIELKNALSKLQSAEDAEAAAFADDDATRRAEKEHGWDKAVAILEEEAAEEDRKAAEAKRNGEAPASQDHGPNQTKVLPDFPWPPPPSSASYVLPGEMFSRYTTVGEVSSGILKALEGLGYVEHSFFGTAPGGVALVTRLERMAGDGAPAPAAERWPNGFQAQQPNFAEFLKGLFFVQPGRYRVIVFILQDLPFQQSRKAVSGDEAKAWLHEGLNKLPQEIADRPFGTATCTALIYEFASDGTSVKLVDSALTGKQHLEKAGVLAALQ
jgi:hypothetical protein